MDAQDAAGPDKTKPAAAAASESKPPPDHEPPTETRPPKSTTPTNPSVIDRGPSPTVDKNVQPANRSSVESADEKNATDATNSDAETIVLPGKDGHSPSKIRKVKHEDKSEDDHHSLSPSPTRLPARLPARLPPNDEGRGRERERREQGGPRERDNVKDRGKTAEREPSTVAGATGSTDSALSQIVKKKRLHDKLSEKPSLPPPVQQAKDVSVSKTSSPPPIRRKSADANPHIQSDSNSETSRPKSPKASKDFPKGADRVTPLKRKAPRLESDDEDEIRKARRQRTAPASTNPDLHPSKQAREQLHQQLGGSKSHHHTRSVSPHSQAHRRSASTQLPAHSSSGLSQKKKRVPAPLQSTEYHSDESSASGSPHPRSSKLRSLATPAAADSAVSPAKMGPHKKHLDAHGQTFLARACARGEYDQAKHRLAERPEDLNVADYAGNTPLQIAAINGCEDIVELLINAGCNLECVNYDKDTPLLDAVDNGHIAVVKLLLDAGVNPRKANVHGEEPLDRVNDELDNAEEIRSMLVNARRHMGDRRRTSEEHHDGRASYGPESPRRSPNVSSNPNAQTSNGRRGGAVRSTKTSNHLLYMPMDDKTLRTAAGRGDEETVTRILQVRDGCDDPEAMVNAARGGHDLVMQLLLALGGANPDPPPVTHMSAEVATPMLAAIGQENIKVIQLLLDQANFDPTRRFKGETYYVIARRRQGTNWKDEEDILRKAYEGHKKPRPKDSSKNRSPARREREKEKDEREQKRPVRVEAKDDAARVLKRSATSPARPGESKKKVSSKPTSSPKEKRRSHDDTQSSPKRGSSRPKNDDRLPAINVSDLENSPALHKPSKMKRADSELAGVSSEGDTVKPRRKLVSKGELRGERGKQRRASQVSAASSAKDPASPHDSRSDDHPEKERPEKERPEKVRPEKDRSEKDRPEKDRPEKERLKGEKYHDRTKALKRDQSRDRPAVSAEGAKRHRPSATPPHSNSGDKDDSEVPTKKRRLDTDGKERRPKPSSLSEDRPPKPTMSRDQSLAKSMKAAKLSQKAARDDDDRKEHRVKKSSDAHRRESAKSSSSDKSIHVKCEDADVDMKDAPTASHRDEADLKKAKQLQDESEKKRAADLAEAAAREEKKRREAEEKEKEREKEKEKKKREEEEAKRKEEDEKKRRKEEDEKKRRKEEDEKIRRKEEDEKKCRKEEEERRRRAEEDKKRKEEEEQKRKEEEQRKRKAEEERKRKVEEDLRRQKEEEERKRKEEERIRREEEERKRREEAEKKRKEEEERLRKDEELKKREAEEKRKREEEERLLREQLEREATEAARRKREDDDRREREHRERQRTAREAEFRRQREEQERIRLAKLPALLRWLETCPNPKTTALADKFKHMQGVRYDTIRPEANGTADGREQWVLNTQVALLLGEKDLSLSRYTAWERISVSDIAKKSILRLETERYALTTPSVYDLGRQLPDYYGKGVDPDRMTSDVLEGLRREARDKFLHTNMFFVKLSDLLFIVPTIPHLRGLRLSVEYRELLESEAQLHGWTSSTKWKGDPDADQYLGFAPRHRYYVNGALVGVERPKLSATSSTPFPEKRVPRRNGLTRVYPDEPDYAEICRKQGLEHLLTEPSAPAPAPGPVTPNGVARPNGLSTSVEETSPQAATRDRPHVNGVYGESRTD